MKGFDGGRGDINTVRLICSVTSYTVFTFLISGKIYCLRCPGKTHTENLL